MACCPVLTGQARDGQTLNLGYSRPGTIPGCIALGRTVHRSQWYYPEVRFQRRLHLESVSAPSAERYSSASYSRQSPASKIDETNFALAEAEQLWELSRVNLAVGRLGHVVQLQCT